MDREFDLINEPWIKVMKPDKSVHEVSLRSVFADAHEYTCLAGETKSQDFALLRLLLAIMYTVFSRYDENGDDIDPTDDDYEPIDTWRNIWSAGKIPMAPIDKYFDKWHDRFWLFDEKYPFYQSNAVKGKSKPISTGKLIGSLFESANKPRLFSDRSNEGRVLSYPEAARWLIHLISFDDIAAKQPTPKKTWCGKLGLIAVRGKTLFETLMLNYVADSESIENSTPMWESEPSENFNRLIAVPDNQAAMLTIRSRHLYLCRENGMVNGYYLAGGDYFDEEDHVNEMMTIWRGYEEKKNSPIIFRPARHDSSKTAWQEFGVITAFPDTDKSNDSGKKVRAPGILQWIKRLKEVLGKKYMVHIETAAVLYDYGQATSLPVIDVISDSLSFHETFLEEIGVRWRNCVNEEIGKCEKCAKAVYSLSINLQTAAGASGDQLSGSNAKMQFYDRIDSTFRQWLESIDPERDDLIEKSSELENSLFTIAARLGNELAAQTGNSPIFGRYIKPDKKDKGKTVYSSAEAMNKYMGTIRMILTKAGENNGQS